MSSIPELLKEGFDNEDWGRVSDAYHMLTGEHLAPPVSENEQKGFSQEIHHKEEASYISKAYDGDRPDFQGDTGGQQARKEPMSIPEKRNLEWSDDGTIAANEKVSENPNLGVSNPVKRNRRGFDKTQRNSKSDVRLDKSEKLKDINE